jgi:hypothetical protein
MKNFLDRPRIIALALAGVGMLTIVLGFTTQANQDRWDEASAPPVTAPVTTAPLSQEDRCVTNGTRLVMAAYGAGINNDTLMVITVRQHDGGAAEVLSKTIVYTATGYDAPTALRKACQYHITYDESIGALDSDPDTFVPASLVSDTSYP